MHIFKQSVIDEVSDFANKINTSYYSNRNQNDNEKRKFDQIVGKLGEFLVYDTLTKNYQDLTKPDLNIYEKNKKSWDYDLKCSTFNLHVKSQDIKQAEKFGTSWIFQKDDKEILNYKENDYVAFVLIDYNKKYGILKKILSVKDLHEHNLFKQPKVFQLRAYKVVVYYDDIENFKNELKLQSPLGVN